MDNLDSRVFRKMGWEQVDAGRNADDLWWWSADRKDGGYFQELPPISSSWEVCAKYLAVWMRKRGWYYCIKPWPDKFIWMHGPRTGKDVEIELKGHNLALAACEAFMEVELNEKA